MLAVIEVDGVFIGGAVPFRDALLIIIVEYQHDAAGDTATQSRSVLFASLGRRPAATLERTVRGALNMTDVNEHLLQHPTPALLRRAYANGIFPMADPDTDRIEWFKPMRRGVLPLEQFHVPKALRRVVRADRFAVRCDTAFEAVMRQCASSRGNTDESWINERLIEAYVALHEAGHAHSVEAYRSGKLVGGLYGVHLGAAFFGESMFVRPEQGGTDASKVCLVHLVNHLKQRGFMLLDTQFWNPHLAQFGCEEIDAEAYDELLAEAIHTSVTWGVFEIELQ